MVDFVKRGEWGNKGWHFEDGRMLRKGAFWWNGGVREALYRLRTVCFFVMDRNSGDQGQHHSNNEDSIPAWHSGGAHQQRHQVA